MQVVRIDFKLELGSLEETVEVSGESPVLQTENAVVGEVISGSTVMAMPLNGRNFSQLALLVPGVQTHTPDSFTPREGRQRTRAGPTGTASVSRPTTT